MKFRSVRLVLAISVSAFTSILVAQTNDGVATGTAVGVAGAQTRRPELPDTPGAVSSSSSAPAEADRNAENRSATVSELSTRGDRPFAEPLTRPGFRLPPLAMTAKLGTTGAGAELATRLAPRVNLRVGAQFLDHPTTFSAYGVDNEIRILFQNIYTAVDLYPFHNSFHLSPGVTFHVQNHIATAFTVPGGQKLSLGSGDYVSDPSNPIQGTGMITIGNKIAPRLTAGWGNLFPRSGSRWSVPFEVGFQLSAPPTVQLSLHGSACDSDGNCGDINSGTGPADLAREVKNAQDMLSPLRLYPIASVGISYSLGRSTKKTR